MKRQLCFLLAICLCLSLLGCSHAINDTITFYYCRDPDSYQYFTPDAVIVAERRDLSGQRNDAPYLLRLYLAGPLDEELHSPLPRNTHLVQAVQTETAIEIDLSAQDTTMTDAAFSLACACLAKTCIGYFGCEEVIIRSGSRSITMTSDTIVLFDGGTQETTNGG